MEYSLKKNVLLLALSGNYSRYIGQKTANFFDLFYVDLNDILEYNLINQQMLDIAGKEYFESEKSKVIKSVMEYENSLVVGNIELFLQNNNIQKFKKDFAIIYLYLDKQTLEDFDKDYSNKRNYIAFEEEDKICKIYCDKKIDVKSTETKDFENIKNNLKDVLTENFV